MVTKIKSEKNSKKKSKHKVRSFEKAEIFFFNVCDDRIRNQIEMTDKHTQVDNTVDSKQLAEALLQPEQDNSHTRVPHKPGLEQHKQEPELHKPEPDILARC
jgi:hypothetical protein